MIICDKNQFQIQGSFFKINHIQGLYTIYLNYETL